VFLLSPGQRVLKKEKKGTSLSVVGRKNYSKQLGGKTAKTKKVRSAWGGRRGGDDLVVRVFNAQSYLFNRIALRRKKH